MKKLLQNKRFRINLYKWLSMYICVMAVFTTVVTYSKYISNMGTDEYARVANFEIGIDFNNCPSDKLTVTPNADNTSVHTCDMGTFRPTSVLPYQFLVDSTKLEADATLVVTLRVSSLFEIVELKNNTTGTIYVKDGATMPNTGTTIGLTKEGDTSINIAQDVLAKDGQKENYTIKIRYKDPLVTDDANEIFSEGKEIINIGYAATQKIK